MIAPFVHTGRERPGAPDVERFLVHDLLSLVAIKCVPTFTLMTLLIYICFYWIILKFKAFLMRDLKIFLFSILRNKFKDMFALKLKLLHPMIHDPIDYVLINYYKLVLDLKKP